MPETMSTTTDAATDHAPATALVVTHNLTPANVLHCARLGGMAAPSLAITRLDAPLTKFGGITLVAPVSLADPAGRARAKVFGADVYSPRYPKVYYKVRDTDVAQLNDRLGAWREKTRARALESGEIEKEGPWAFSGNAAVMAAFLEQQGLTPKIVMVPEVPPERVAKLREGGMEKYFTIDKATTILADPEFEDKSVAQVVQDYRRINMPAIADRYATNPALRSEVARNTAEEIAKMARQAKAPLTDPGATYSALVDQIDDGGLREPFEGYAQQMLDDLHPQEKLSTGYSATGKRRYIEHTMDAVLKHLKKELRSGEGFNFGLGNLRALLTPQFSSLSAVRANADLLVDDATFEQVKKDVDTRFYALAEQLAPYHPKGMHLALGDLLRETMSEAVKRPTAAALERADFANVPADLVQGVTRFIDDLRRMPTEYFEVKILRAVEFSEFAGALVPASTSAGVRQALANAGLTVREYTGPEDRTLALQGLVDTLQQAGQKVTMPVRIATAAQAPAAGETETTAPARAPRPR